MIGRRRIAPHRGPGSRRTSRRGRRPRAALAVAALAALAVLAVTAPGCGETIDRRVDGATGGTAPRSTGTARVAPFTGETGETGPAGSFEPPSSSTWPETPPTSLGAQPAFRSQRTATTQPAPVDTRVWPACPDGTRGRYERREVHSEALLSTQPTQRLLVYLPPCADRDRDRRYPVLYLLHGAQADETQWADVGLAETADRLITSGSIPPLIIVLVDGLWAMGQYAGTPQLMDIVLLDEVAPAIESWYPTIADRAHRAIGGISRGGEWALLVAGHHPNEFGAVGGHSPAVGAPGSPNDLLVPLVASSRPRVWLDVGTGDGLVASVDSFSRALRDHGVAHEYHNWPGGHDRAYWGDHAADYLRFYSAGWPAPEPDRAAPPPTTLGGR